MLDGVLRSGQRRPFSLQQIKSPRSQKVHTQTIIELFYWLELTAKN